MFRTVDCSPGLHQGLRSHVSVGTLSRDQTSLVSGQRVDSCLFGTGSQTGRPVAPLALLHPWDCDKREEVGSRALVDCEISRHDHRYRGRQGFSVSGASREIPDGSGELLYHGLTPSSALAGVPRSPGFARAAGSSRTPSDAHFTVASEGAREVRWDLSWWMVRDHLLTGVQFGTSSPDLHLYSDAFCLGWGAHHLDQHVSGVWSDQEKLLHINLLEMKALFLGLQSFREDVIGHHVTAMCDNSTVVAYANRQGGMVSRALCFVDQPPSEMDGEFRHPYRCEVSSRTSQCPGRSPQPSRASCRDRVVSPPSGGEVTASCLGQSVDRPLCDVPQRETAPVLLSSLGSPDRLLRMRFDILGTTWTCTRSLPFLWSVG